MARPPKKPEDLTSQDGTAADAIQNAESNTDDNSNQGTDTDNVDSTPSDDNSENAVILTTHVRVKQFRQTEVFGAGKISIPDTSTSPTQVYLKKDLEKIEAALAEEGITIEIVEEF